jgi:integrase
MGDRMGDQTLTKKSKRRVRSPHPGVRLKKRSRTNGLVQWIARFVDPDTSRETEVSLTALGKKTEESRRAWAIDKSRSLIALRASIASGTAVRSNTLVVDAFAAYFKARLAEGLKPLTVVAYQTGTKAFEEWAGANGLVFVESLSPSLLAKFRDWFVAIPANVPIKGRGGKSRWAAGARKRRPAAINKGLNSLRIVLNGLRRRGLVPLLHSDDIRDRLGYVKGVVELPVFLRQPQVLALLRSCEAHDAETFTLTRDGRTDVARHVSIRPFTYAMLMTGLRFSELAELRWCDVDLEQRVIRLEHFTKGDRARLVSLDVCPTLVTMLERMKLTAGREPRVFPAITRDVAETARERLVDEYGAPAFTWHDLRRTCGTFSVCAGVHGPASPYLTARRLGHSIAVAEKHYLGQVSGLNATTLEAAYGLPVAAPVQAQQAS